MNQLLFFLAVSYWLRCHGDAQRAERSWSLEEEEPKLREDPNFIRASCDELRSPPLPTLLATHLFGLVWVLAALLIKFLATVPGEAADDHLHTGMPASVGDAHMEFWAPPDYDLYIPGYWQSPDK